ncbi:MAG: sigma-70 family RNA polymerase sigma factor [Pirellulaceae bacterium]|nr:sigma-70 family RNA polymerase sigma factor [Pirellulaceae bacterium]
MSHAPQASGQPIAAPSIDSSTSDRDLLARFLAERDETAFAALVIRYRETVLGACLRVLRNAQDAEDASQAAFLVLARKARSLAGYASLGGWLHEVARRTALKLRGRRRTIRTLDEEPAAQPATLSDVSAALDDELQKLPVAFRDTLVLCCLEGLSRAEAAERLGVSEGAVKDRLERGREALRSRLVRRGLTLSAGFVALFLGGAGTAMAGPPAAGSVAATAQAASLLASGGSLAGVVPAAVISLADGVLKAMLFEKVKIGMAACLSLLAAGFVAQAMLIDNPGRFDEGLRGHVVSVQGEQPRSLTFTIDDHEVVLNLDVAADATVTLAYEQAQLADIKPGMYLAVKLASDHRTIREINVLGTTKTGQVVSYDPSARLLTLDEASDDDDEDEGQPPRRVSYTVAAGAITRFDGGPGRLDDLEPGLGVTLELARDLRAVNAVSADWRLDGDLDAEVTARDPASGKLTILADDSETQREITFAAGAKVFLDGKPSRGGELKPNDVLVLRFSADGEVIACRAMRPIPEKEDEDEGEEERE